MQRLLQRGAAGDEFLKVAASGKCLLAGTANDDATDAAVDGDFGHVFGQLLPHAEVDGVQLAKVI